MDIVANLGALALGSRCKRLSDRLFAEVAIIYAEKEIDLDPKYFALLQALRTKDGCGVVELASQLGVTHAAISVLVKSAKDQGLVRIDVPQNDTRCRLAYLTPKAQEIIQRLEPVWLELRKRLTELLHQAAPHLLSELAAFEDVIARGMLRKKDVPVETVELLEWDPSYAAAFRDLNEAWIRRYFVIEEEDRKVLHNPQAAIIDRGGMVFFSIVGGAVVGTCAVLPVADGTYELMKMAVSPVAQGKGIGAQLLAEATRWVEKQGAQRLYLETATILTAAIRMYRQNGFVPCEPLHPTQYGRVDLTMEKPLGGRRRT